MHHISTHLLVSVIGSPTLYLLVRAGFVNQGITLNKWCILRGVNRQTAEKALKGISTSKKSLALVSEALAAATQKQHRRA